MAGNPDDFSRAATSCTPTAAVPDFSNGPRRCGSSSGPAAAMHSVSLPSSHHRVGHSPGRSPRPAASAARVPASIGRQASGTGRHPRSSAGSRGGESVQADVDWDAAGPSPICADRHRACPPRSPGWRPALQDQPIVFRGQCALQFAEPTGGKSPRLNCPMISRISSRAATGVFSSCSASATSF